MYGLLFNSFLLKFAVLFFLDYSIGSVGFSKKKKELVEWNDEAACTNVFRNLLPYIESVFWDHMSPFTTFIIIYK